MHSLEIIIARNAEQAGREYAHQECDGRLQQSPLFPEDVSPNTAHLAAAAWIRGYERGKQEG